MAIETDEDIIVQIPEHVRRRVVEYNKKVLKIKPNHMGFQGWRKFKGKYILEIATATALTPKQVRAILREHRRAST